MAFSPDYEKVYIFNNQDQSEEGISVVVAHRRDSFRSWEIMAKFMSCCGGDCNPVTRDLFFNRWQDGEFYKWNFETATKDFIFRVDNGFNSAFIFSAGGKSAYIVGMSQHCIYKLDYEMTGGRLGGLRIFCGSPGFEIEERRRSFPDVRKLLVIPAFTENPVIPSGIWEDLSVVTGDRDDRYQAKLKVKGGSILPARKIIQNTNENSFDPLTLTVCLNEKGKAEGKLYMDAGDGWEFQKGDYCMMDFMAEKKGNTVTVKLVGKQGKRKTGNEIKGINVEILSEGRLYKETRTF